MTYLIYAVLILFGLFYTVVSVMKLSRHPHFVQEFASMQVPYGLAILSGAVEVVAGPALIAGIWFPLAAGLASAVMFFVMLGAAVANFFSEGRGAWAAIGVFVVCAIPMLLIAFYYLDTTRSALGM